MEVAQTEQDNALEEAAFNAAFNKVPDEVVIETLPETPAVEEVAQEVAEVVAGPMFAGMTEEQLTNVLSRIGEIDTLRTKLDEVRDSLHGKIGGIKTQLDKVSQVKQVVNSSPFSDKAKERFLSFDSTNLL